MDVADEVPGYHQFAKWCGGWPSFHDSEIIKLELNRSAPSRLVVHVLGGPKPAFGPRSDVRYSSPPNDVVVTFIFEQLEDLELDGFSQQNVLFGLHLQRDAGLFQLTMDPCCGVGGKISVRKVSIEFSPVDLAADA